MTTENRAAIESLTTAFEALAVRGGGRGVPVRLFVSRDHK
jgi:hypothetical protein